MVCSQSKHTPSLRGLPLRHHGLEALCRLVFSRVCRVVQGGREVSLRRKEGKRKNKKQCNDGTVVTLMRMTWRVLSHHMTQVNQQREYIMWLPRLHIKTWSFIWYRSLFRRIYSPSPPSLASSSSQRQRSIAWSQLFSNPSNKSQPCILFIDALSDKMHD